jgi:hypothetical protein
MFSGSDELVITSGVNELRYDGVHAAVKTNEWSCRYGFVDVFYYYILGTELRVY